MAEEDKDLHRTLGALLQSSTDIKDELKYIHQYIARVEIANKHAIEKVETTIKTALDKVDTDTTKKLNYHDTRLKTLEKKQYAIITIAIGGWAVAVGLLRKLLG